MKRLFIFLLIFGFIFGFRTEVFAGEGEPNGTSQKSEDGFFKMSLEELMEVKVSSATLTQTSARLVPAAVTTITAEDIRLSGARSLFELLDIYVPNLLWLRHHYEGDALGLRGIIGDRNDKYLLLVNGRSINQKTHAGAVTEQDLVMLSDIHHIDVVRGPGSAMYGPGAVAMVINIITLSSDTFEGTEVINRTGAIEEFYSLEVKHGKKFKDGDGGFFLYGGIGKYVGADKFDSPQIYPHTFSTRTWSTWRGPTYVGAPAGSLPGDGIQSGEPARGFVNRDGAAARDLLPLKLYAQMKKNNWDIWGRYTRGGKEFGFHTESIARAQWGNGENNFSTTTTPIPWAGTFKNRNFNFYSYQQFTGNVGYKQELSESINVDYAFGYTMTDYQRFMDNRLADASREDQYYAKALLHWKPNEKHKFALGFEYTHMELGMNPIGWPNRHAISALQTSAGVGRWNSSVAMPQWGTDMYSVLGEWQWTISDKWTAFIGARVDRHTFTEEMFSPRAAIVYTPNKRDTWKLMWSRSTRANFEENMKKTFDNTGKLSDPEKLDSIELRYERQQNKNLDLAASIFVHYSLQAIAWNNTASTSDIGGTQREYGVELEATYHTEKTRLTISHGYTKLYGYYLTPGSSTYITSKPYGYGDDLTNWSNHITKLTLEHKLDDKWTFDASFRVYWGFPGLEDRDAYDPYNNVSRGKTASGGPQSFPVIDDGWERAYRGSYFLNMGLQYKPNKNLTVGINGYNLLGVFNMDLNKRNYVNTGAAGGDFRSVAPAVAVTIAYAF